MSSSLLCSHFGQSGKGERHLLFKTVVELPDRLRNVGVPSYAFFSLLPFILLQGGETMSSHFLPNTMANGGLDNRSKSGRYVPFCLSRDTVFSKAIPCHFRRCGRRFRGITWCAASSFSTLSALPCSVWSSAVSW